MSNPTVTPVFITPDVAVGDVEFEEVEIASHASREVELRAVLAPRRAPRYQVPAFREVAAGRAVGAEQPKIGCSAVVPALPNQYVQAFAAPGDDERRSAYEVLFRAHYGAVQRFVHAHYPNADSSEVMSATFEIAWRRFDSIPADAERGWLISVARNCCRNSLRASRRRRAHLDALHAAARTQPQESEPITALDLDAVTDAFAKLSSRDQEVLLMAEWDGEELAAALMRAGAPAEPVLETHEVVAHPHTIHRKMTVDIDGFRTLGNPIKMSRTPPEAARLRPPRFGQDTRAVLAEVGYSEAEIDALIASGAALDKPRD